eukprot:jgi/Tetstr1/465036/TSEL_009764.t1
MAERESLTTVLGYPLWNSVPESLLCFEESAPGNHKPAGNYMSSGGSSAETVWADDDERSEIRENMDAPPSERTSGLRNKENAPPVLSPSSQRLQVLAVRLCLYKATVAIINRNNKRVCPSEDSGDSGNSGSHDAARYSGGFGDENANRMRRMNMSIFGQDKKIKTETAPYNPRFREESENEDYAGLASDVFYADTFQGRFCAELCAGASVHGALSRVAKESGLVQETISLGDYHSLHDNVTGARAFWLTIMMLKIHDADDVCMYLLKKAIASEIRLTPKERKTSINHFLAHLVHDRAHLPNEFEVLASMTPREIEILRGERFCSSDTT